MQRPILKPVGTSIEELDTPALLLDLGKFDDVASQSLNDLTPARVEVWVHKTPAIAHRQIALPGVAGIAVRSIAEAEVFAAAGFDDIQIMRPLVTSTSRQRAEALAATARLAFEPDRPLRGADWFDEAVSISTRVVSVPEPGRAILDAGQKSVGRDFGDPIPLGFENCTVSAGSAEHGIMAFPTREAIAMGDWLRLRPADMATAFALHDFVYAIRDGLLEAVWPVTARGAF